MALILILLAIVLVAWLVQNSMPGPPLAKQVVLIVLVILALYILFRAVAPNL